MTETAKTKQHLVTDAQWRALTAIADCIIPASAEFDAPSAGDAAICKAIVKGAGRRLEPLRAALSTLDDLARASQEAAFADLDGARRQSVAEAFRSAHPAAAELLELLTTQCYYRDDRVMISLGIPVRPPHPEGYTVEQGDWSLLDPVRRRPEFHR